MSLFRAEFTLCGGKEWKVFLVLRPWVSHATINEGAFLSQIYLVYFGVSDLLR